jgi:hypothetical protein
MFVSVRNNGISDVRHTVLLIAEQKHEFVGYLRMLINMKLSLVMI